MCFHVFLLHLLIIKYLQTTYCISDPKTDVVRKKKSQRNYVSIQSVGSR